MGMGVAGCVRCVVVLQLPRLTQSLMRAGAQTTTCDCGESAWWWWNSPRG
jgi:hypothetical protein